VQYLKCPEGGGKETRLDISNSTFRLAQLLEDI